MGTTNNVKANIMETFIREGKEYNCHKDISEADKIDLEHELPQSEQKKQKK